MPQKCFAFCLLLFFSSVLLGTLPADYQTGLLLEAMTYDWCHADCGPFTTESALICVQVEGKTLIGERNLDHDWRHYYPQLQATQGKSIPVRYEAMARTDGAGGPVRTVRPYSFSLSLAA